MQYGQHDIQGEACTVCGRPEGVARRRHMASAGCPGVRWPRVDDKASILSMTYLLGLSTLYHASPTTRQHS
jgi:hypothetical protein